VAAHADIDLIACREEEAELDRIPRWALAAAFARAVDAKDAYTSSHSSTVSTFCVLVAERLGLPPRHVAKIRIAGMLHDVGKIGTPDRILNKPGPLTPDEFEVIKEHPAKGAEIMRAATLDEEAVWILHHHERIDGGGYPAGLQGEEIPIESRIILVADALEALTSDRPYRKGRGTKAALEEIEANAGTQFDATLVEALLSVLGRGEVTERRREPMGNPALALVGTLAIPG
jgi:putative nucleotidyltransferase with HDIG domain